MFLIWGNTLGYFSCMNGGGESDGHSQSEGLEKGHPSLDVLPLNINYSVWAGLTAVLKYFDCVN